MNKNSILFAISIILIIVVGFLISPSFAEWFQNFEGSGQIFP